jgi:CPA1 family monovalent cation:H+ antiporter
LSAARISLAEAGLAALDGKSGAVADHWRRSLDMTRAAVSPDGDASALDAKRELGLSVLRAQRLKLQDLRKEQRVSSEAYIVLQEELDFQEVSLTTEDERHVEQS